MASITSTITLLLRHIGLLDGKTVHTSDDETITGTKNFTGTLQAGGYPVEAVVESGDGYIRYASGIQMCWGRTTLNGPITSTNKLVTFPKAFNASPAVVTCSNANYLGMIVMVGWESKTSFTIGTRSGETSTGETNWIAYGTWE